MALRVAIFEDNKLVRDSFEAILNGTEGFICTGAFSGCNNLNQDMRKSNPDVVLMDIEMAGMNGIEATKSIRRDFPAVKVLIQTVFEEEEKIFAAVCAGASGYILKKTTPAKFIEAIMEVYSGGAPMNPGIAHKVLDLFQQFAPRQAGIIPDETSTLSAREKEVLSLMMEGEHLHQIAVKTYLSYETIRSHVKNIYKKLHVHSFSEAVVKAYKQRLL